MGSRGGCSRTRMRAGERAGIATMLLEATELGEPLYRRLGYVVEHDTVIVAREASEAGAAPAACAIGALDSRAFAALCALDREATGTDRADMLAALLAEGVAIETIAGRAAGELRAAGMLVGDRVGPVLARDLDAGHAIVDRLAPAARIATIPAPNAAAIAAFARHGFREQRVAPDAARAGGRDARGLGVGVGEPGRGVSGGRQR